MPVPMRRAAAVAVACVAAAVAAGGAAADTLGAEPVVGSVLHAEAPCVAFVSARTGAAAAAAVRWPADGPAYACLETSVLDLGEVFVRNEAGGEGMAAGDRLPDDGRWERAGALGRENSPFDFGSVADGAVVYSEDTLMPYGVGPSGWYPVVLGVVPAPPANGTLWYALAPPVADAGGAGVAVAAYPAVGEHPCAPEGGPPCGVSDDEVYDKMCRGRAPAAARVPSRDREALEWLNHSSVWTLKATLPALPGSNLGPGAAGSPSAAPYEDTSFWTELSLGARRLVFRPAGDPATLLAAILLVRHELWRQPPRLDAELSLRVAATDKARLADFEAVLEAARAGDTLAGVVLAAAPRRLNVSDDDADDDAGDDGRAPADSSGKAAAFWIGTLAVLLSSAYALYLTFSRRRHSGAPDLDLRESGSGAYRPVSPVLDTPAAPELT